MIWAQNLNFINPSMTGYFWEYLSLKGCLVTNSFLPFFWCLWHFLIGLSFSKEARMLLSRPSSSPFLSFSSFYRNRDKTEVKLLGSWSLSVGSVFRGCRSSCLKLNVQVASIESTSQVNGVNGLRAPPERTGVVSR